MNMKLIYIKSTMEPKNYSTIRSILKKAQGEKIAPYVFKINDTQALQEYLDKEKIPISANFSANTFHDFSVLFFYSEITYEIYQEERKIMNIKKRKQDNDMPLQNNRQKYLDKKF